MKTPHIWNQARSSAELQSSAISSTVAPAALRASAAARVLASISGSTA